MPDIEFDCPACKVHLAVDQKDAGERVNCPECGAEIRIPTAAVDKIHSQFKNLPGSTSKKICPECKSEIDKDDVLCINCGTNLVTGKHILEPTPPPARSLTLGRLILYGVGAVAILAGGFVGFWLVNRKEKHEPIQPVIAASADSIAAPVSTPVEDVDTVMSNQALALANEFLSLSNRIAQCATTNDFKTTIAGLKSYRGPFTNETAAFRNDQIALLEKEVAALEAAIREKIIPSFCLKHSSGRLYGPYELKEGVKIGEGTSAWEVSQTSSNSFHLLKRPEGTAYGPFTCEQGSLVKIGNHTYTVITENLPDAPLQDQQQMGK